MHIPRYNLYYLSPNSLGLRNHIIPHEIFLIEIKIKIMVAK